MCTALDLCSTSPPQLPVISIFLKGFLLTGKNPIFRIRNERADMGRAEAFMVSMRWRGHARFRHRTGHLVCHSVPRLQAGWSTQEIRRVSSGFAVFLALLHGM